MKTFSHVALLGRQPELGLVELESVVGAEGVEPLGRQLALVDRSLDVGKLGGVIKLGRVIYDGVVTDLQALPIDLNELPTSDSKLSFALSVYADRASAKMVIAAGLTLKKLLKERGSIRLLTPANGTEVSVAQLKHNRVIEDGFELMIVVVRERMLIARTEQIQDIDWYSKRDYDRPARSAKVGMLPPKLAQILVNTTKSGVPVVDPFCGTGVVLQEALLMGRGASGSDIAPEMVAASTENLEWLRGQVAENLPGWTVELRDAREATLPPQVAIVSEGYLGPNLSSDPSKQLASIRAELKELYTASLSHWATQLASGAELALCAPAWRSAKVWEYLGLVDDLPRLGYTVKVFKHAQAPFLYRRDDQIVGRQLLLLRKI